MGSSFTHVSVWSVLGGKWVFLIFPSFLNVFSLSKGDPEAETCFLVKFIEAGFLFLSLRHSLRKCRTQNSRVLLQHSERVKKEPLVTGGVIYVIIVSEWVTLKALWWTFEWLEDFGEVQSRFCWSSMSSQEVFSQVTEKLLLGIHDDFSINLHWHVIALK